MARREEEVLLQKRSMPSGVDTTLAVLLKEENAEVYLPKDLDADDVVANLAKERRFGHLIHCHFARVASARLLCASLAFMVMRDSLAALLPSQGLLPLRPGRPG
jgi:hypothetical protein